MTSHKMTNQRKTSLYRQCIAHCSDVYFFLQQDEVSRQGLQGKGGARNRRYIWKCCISLISCWWITSPHFKAPSPIIRIPALRWLTWSVLLHYFAPCRTYCIRRGSRCRKFYWREGLVVRMMSASRVHGSDLGSIPAKVIIPTYSVPNYQSIPLTLLIKQ